MILIGENIHIISKSVRSALENRDENFVKNLIKIQEKTDVLDLNIGPASGKLDMIFDWLCPLTNGKPVSFDSSNINAIKRGLEICASPDCFINSTTADEDRLEILSDMALEYGCNLISLTMTGQNGIPKTAEERMELVFGIYEKCAEKSMPCEKLFIDPLVLPVKVEQQQGIEVINTIKMVKESFDPAINTVIGLSNISNGMPAHLRPLFNRVFAVLCRGAGLDAAIIDARDYELIRIMRMLDNENAQNQIDELYINLSNTVKYFGGFEEVKFDKNDDLQCNIMKTAAVLLNKTVYSDSFTRI